MAARPDTLVRRAVAIVGVAFSVILWLSGVLTPGWFSTVITWTPAVAAFAVVAWGKWVWKWGVFLRTHNRPRIEGLWEGAITPVPDSRRSDTGPVRCFVVIRQSFWSLHVYLCTAESSSTSRSATLCPNDAAGASELMYVYDNEPQAGLLDRSPRHLGAARLHCPGRVPDHLEGAYFTQRLTRGDLSYVSSTDRPTR
ncbi:MAG TPA: hypothetical protein PLK46_03120 [Propioniciclava sp.]|uniref:Cap15 family cyclic dinucleotide receptor domain-containing protein n=1 Tax=Propioniciclava sp. TaxID=2038686 RepID=UPI002C80C9FC|nr:hypothetical protein [Propioniciclava sp.]HRL79309.1 hypothetical protein [Propioniciclava sp.]